jgi:hypothetical protein
MLTVQMGGALSLGNPAGLTGATQITNSGTFDFSGAGTMTLGSSYINQGGNIEVDQGTLAVTATNQIWSGGGNFDAGANAVLQFAPSTSGNGLTLGGKFTGSGSGQVQFTSGNLFPASGATTTFDFPKGMFQWQGGDITNQGTFVNAGFLTLANTSTITFSVGGVAASNSGEIDQTGSGNVAFNGQPFDTPQGGVYNISCTGNLVGSSPFMVEGTLEMSGSGTGTVANPFVLNGGTIDVASGTLSVTSSNVAWTGGTFDVASGAVLQLASVASAGNGIGLSGAYAGSGGGQVQLTTGSLAILGGGAVLDFPQSLFQWTGGEIVSIITLNNASVVTLEGSMIDKGVVDQVGSGGLSLFGGSTLDVPTGGVFDLSGEGGISGGGPFSVEGLLQMTGGGTDTISNNFVLNGGTIDVASGTLSVTSSNVAWTGGTFDVASGAVLQLASVASAANGINMSGLYTGSGPGQVLLITGGLSMNGTAATFDFPAGFFQWQGGSIETFGSGSLTNTGFITLNNSSGLTLSGNVVNQGEIDLAGAGGLTITNFANQAGGVIDFQNDASIFGNFSQPLVNNGTVEKTGGTGTSGMTNMQFVHANDTIAVTSGTLTINSNADFSTGGTFNVSAGCVLDLSGASGENDLVGTYTGLGAGHVELTSGDLGFGGRQAGDLNATVLDLTGGGFLWTGGVLVVNSALGTPTLTNSGLFTVATGNAVSENAPFINSGTLTVDAGSTFSVNNSFTQTSTGVLSVQLGGTAAGTFGVLAAASAALDGKLQATLVNGYAPALADNLKVVTYGSETGTFSAFDMPTNAGVSFTVAVNAADVLLSGAQASADLALQGIDSITPSVGLDGQNLTVSYKVVNDGSPTPASSWVDSVFLSADGQLDSSSVLLGRTTHAGSLGSGVSYEGSVTAPVPGVLPGDYSVIVETDSQSVVPDRNRANNLLVSASPVPVSTPALTVTAAGAPLSPVSGTIASNSNLFYEFAAPGSQDIELTLSGAIGGEAQLFESAGGIPTTAIFDAEGSPTGLFQQQLVLSAPPAGVYFILLDGLNAAGTGQAFTITAQALAFGVRTISPTRGGNAGQTTITLNGAKFTSKTTVSLIGSDNASHSPVSTMLFNSNQLSATFDLTGLAPGKYSVEGVDPTGVTATLDDAFTVDAGPVGQLTVNLNTPAAVRPGVVNSLTVQIANTGDDDVTAPDVLLESSSAVFVTNDPVYLGTMTIVPSVAVAPPGVLPPGAVENLTVPFISTKTSGSVDFEYGPEPADTTFASRLESARQGTTAAEAGASGRSNRPKGETIISRNLCDGARPPINPPAGTSITSVTAAGNVDVNTQGGQTTVEAAPGAGTGQGGSVTLNLNNGNTVIVNFRIVDCPPDKKGDPIDLSEDPNQIIGPAGIGSQRFVGGGQPLPYQIDFANEPTATAPAQIVTVTQQLDPNLDWSTFQLGSFGFGSISVNVPPGLTSYSTRVDARASVGVFVDVSADFNVQTGLLTWTFTSIDPTTLDVPIGNDALEGFLPPDTNPPLGEGYVAYTVSPKSNIPAGSIVNAQASVVFDTNSPLQTQQISNTIDSVAPMSNVSALAKVNGFSFPVSWSGDDAGGSGIATYNVYVSDNGGAPTLFQQNVASTSAVFSGGQDGHTYSFYSLATSNAGNAQSIPQLVQETTVSIANELPLHLPKQVVAGGKNTLTVDAADAAGLADPSFNGTATLTPLSGPKGGKITGTLNAPFTAGTADFTNVSASLPGTYTLVVASSAGLASAIETLDVIDAPKYQVTLAPASAGQSGSGATYNAVISATLGGKPDTAYDGSITLTSSDPQAAPLTGAFSSADKGVLTIPIVLRTAGKQTVTVADSTLAVDKATSNAVTVSGFPSALDHFIVSGVPSTAVAGVAHTVTITAANAAGQTDTNFTGTVTLSGGGVNVPVAFTSKNKGVATATVTFGATGAVTLTASGGGKTGAEANINVVSPATHLGVSVSAASVAAGQSVMLTITALTSANKTDSIFSDPLSVTISDPSSGAQVTPVNDSGGVAKYTITFGTAGPQTITVTDSARSPIKATLAKVAVSAGKASQLVITSAPLFAVAGNTVPVTVTAEDSFGNTVTSGFLDKVTLSTGGSATFTVKNRGKLLLEVPVARAGTIALTASDATHGNVATSSPRDMDVVASAVGVLTSDPTGGSGEALVVVARAGGATISLTPTNAAGTSIEATEVIGKKTTTFGPFALTTTDHIIVYGTTGSVAIKELTAMISGKTATIAVPALLLGGSGENTISAAGSSADNVLVGGPGKDSLTGGSGGDILIGGGGGDKLTAGVGSDILLSGSTSYDANLAALSALSGEWTGNSSYPGNVNDLLSTGTILLGASTVTPAASSTELIGGPSQDWFVLSPSDQLEDFTTGEVATRL